MTYRERARAVLVVGVGAILAASLWLTPTRAAPTFQGSPSVADHAAAAATVWRRIPGITDTSVDVWKRQLTIGTGTMGIGEAETIASAACATLGASEKGFVYEAEGWSVAVSGAAGAPLYRCYIRR